MSPIKHDPSEYIRGIQQILVSDKKRIGFLFGAGSSLAKLNENSLTVPAIGQMTSEIVSELSEINDGIKNALDEIMKTLEPNFNIETLLSDLEQKEKLIGDGTLNGIKKDDFAQLISSVKESVRKKVSVHIDTEGNQVGRETIENLIQTEFARWIMQAERKFPIEVFTTNYDYLFELGLEYHELPYYDGFSGSYRPFFNPQSVENQAFLPYQTKIWKVHGSLGWHYDQEQERIVRTNPDEKDILIYPSVLKYRDSKKQPYEALMDRLSNFLKHDDSILITCGYAWGDEHINSRIISALKSDSSSHVIGLLYDKVWSSDGKSFKHSFTEDSPLAKIGLNNPKISLYGMKNAVIGCKFGEWQLRSEPGSEDTVQTNLYFDEDAPYNEEDELNEEKTGEASWTGKGEFMLADFKLLVRFLNSMIGENEIKTFGENGK